MVIGHECAGIVEEIGSQVKSLVVGDRVALEPGICCQRCHYCKKGSYNLCPEMKFFGSPQRSPPTNGSLANMVICQAFKTKTITLLSFSTAYNMELKCLLCCCLE